MTGSYTTYYRRQFLEGLENLRYRKNMTLYYEPLVFNEEKPEMMRYLILKSPEVYEELFGFT
jgi:hypothetical protein